MIALTAAEIAQAVGGRLRGFEPAGATSPEQLTLTHADTDSRNMREGSLFIAKPGETTDGHRFIDSALAAGAQLILAERETESPAGCVHPAVIVDDAVAAMGALAAEIIRRIRAHSPTTVIGITGSAGKTTTKDLLAAVLSAEGPTTAPQGSYNGEVGVPLTVFAAELDTRYLIIEMGADAPGNIAYLCRMVQPDIGVVLMVGTAHAGKFGGAEKIAATKGELAELAAGQVILNADDPQVTAMAGRASAPITWFGESAEADVRAENLSLDSAGHPVFDLVTGTDRHRMASGLIGAHHVTNLLAAAAAAQAAGASSSTVAHRLNGLGPSSRWRMERTERADGVTIINDAYNANPESMREALRTLATLARDSGRRSVAVLGPMLELGEESVWRHHQLGETVVRLNIHQTLVVGQEAYGLYRGAIAEGSWADEVHWVEALDEAEAWLATALEPGDIVLFKSSNSAGLRLLGDEIAAGAADPGRQTPLQEGTE
ncbi:UDP-N-acetylmuramoyl-tripeptide--D-alanyl-D-alanine ligase [Nesterenkonia ebinurensis]|uniref:UDP-N-acetylmuramoyl-tripeptide--D-alanyl-D- alanine ligase n=1 Tax=Nesterenkonia ebinurensis TaxID=2608252 RepID=UPI00123DE26B|nr:UDP-N-acetylmuramoyl-tripeptide--D-alanyl-D-alanine ligase [Nesterenkonia ebinurensis]